MKTLTFRAMAWLCGMFMLIIMSSSSFAEELFRDDFDGDALDPVKWSCQERNWPVGWTWFRGCPTVSGGVATFEHHTHNPDDPGNSCLSQEIYSDLAFPRSMGLELKARVRVRGCINGMVTSFFAYMDKEMPTGNPVWSDEIDFEFLSNQINAPPEPGGHRVFVAAWDDFGEPGSGYYDCMHHWGANPVVPGLDLAEFNVFKIRWWADRVEWYWDETPEDDTDDDTMIYTTTCAVPDEPMTVRFNFWAATCGWELACDPDFAPAQSPAEDIVCYYDVDYVRVSTIPSIPAVSEWGLIVMALLVLTTGTLVYMRRRPATR